MAWVAGSGASLTGFVGCWVGAACPAFPTVWEAPVFVERTSVGLDVHARSVVAAGLDTVDGGFVVARLVPRPGVVLDWLLGLPQPVAVAYEAGPTGFGLARALRAAGVRCEVVAPSKLQRPAGDRVKTDERDAKHLARLLRMDQFTAVRVPETAREAARDLVRAREQCRGDLMRARHRVSGLLLRHGIVYSGGSPWTGKHERWLQGARFELPATTAAFEDALDAVWQVTARRDRLDAQIAAMAVDGPWTPLVHRLGCLRGIGTLTAFALAVEVGDFTRFTGRSFPAYVGLVPSEFSTGNSRAQGAITKTGNSHVRRLLIEAAWHHRPAYRPGKTMRERWELASPAARARGDLGNHRLHDRWVRYTQRKKRDVVANTGIARELAGWVWSLAVLDQDPVTG